MVFKWKICFVCLLSLMLFTIPMLALVGISSPSPDVDQAGLAISSEGQSASIETDTQAQEDDSLATLAEAGVWHSDGYFQILDESTGKVNKVSERDYVIGAVCAEMPPTFHTEALKAQAVAAHTYALRLRDQQKQAPDESLKGADFSADPGNWRGYVTKQQAKERFGDNFDLYYGKIEEAVDQVLHIGLAYDDYPIVAAYHAISPGMTENSENIWTSSCDYLKSVESSGDAIAPGYESAVILSKEEVQQILATAYPEIQLDPSEKKWFQTDSLSDSGTVLSISVGDQTLNGSQVRNLFGLRSPNFTVSYENGNFTFLVKGYGHGVGLSQYGADYMARQGSDYIEILTHYYTGVELVKIQF